MMDGGAEEENDRGVHTLLRDLPAQSTGSRRLGPFVRRENMIAEASKKAEIEYRDSQGSAFLWRKTEIAMFIAVPLSAAVAAFALCALFIFWGNGFVMIATLGLVLISYVLLVNPRRFLNDFFIVSERGIERIRIDGSMNSKKCFIAWDDITLVSQYPAPGEGPINEDILVYYDKRQKWAFGKELVNLGHLCRFIIDKVPEQNIWPERTREFLKRCAIKASESPVHPGMGFNNTSASGGHLLRS